MPMFEPRNERFAERVRASFDRQNFMHTIGAQVTAVAPGFVEIRLAYATALCQQHGFFHGGVIGTLADNAAGYAAFSLMSEHDSVLTVEYKMNIVAPGRGEALVARGQVLRPGRTLTVCEAKVYALAGDDERLCATALCTMMTLAEQADAPQ
jgi:uncharacterized protein (TIGR00369 family)